MQHESFTMLNDAGMDIFVQRWTPPAGVPVKAVLQIAHGMCETSDRYADLAALLSSNGYAVYANDHRGHGRTAGQIDRLGDAGENGFNGMIADLLLLQGIIRKQYGELPLFMLGHSMGSFLVQKIMCTEGNAYDGYLLSGSNGPRSLLSFGQTIAALQLRLQGQMHRSLLLNTIVFGPYSKGLGPIRTAFDWLSRDEEEVRRYVEDPYCGQICSTRFFKEFFTLLREIHQPKLLKGLVKNRPIYIFSGEDDPVGMRGKGVRNLIQMYRERGVQQLEYRLYPGGRHEMLHETNRREVEGDVLHWLDSHVQCEESLNPAPLM